MKINEKGIIDNLWDIDKKNAKKNTPGRFDSMLSDAVDELGFFPGKQPRSVNRMNEIIVGGTVDSFNNVANLQSQAKKQMVDFAAGKTDSVHDVMIAMQKSRLTFDLVMGIRNKVITGFKEIMKMPI